eukprot:m51a1_g8844 putative serine threonine-protein kinase edr1-like isoform x1 (1231) ;mRNA; r:455162-460389
MRPRAMQLVAVVAWAATVASATGLVVGMSVGDTELERNAALGLEAALAEASLLAAVPLFLRRRYHSSTDALLRNVDELVRTECAFAVVGKPTTTTDEDRLLDALRGLGVPLVGALSGSESLRNVSLHSADFSRSTGGPDDRLPQVVNVRASAGDEMDLVIAMLAREWQSLASVSMVSQNTPLGNWSDAYLNEVLRALTNKPRNQPGLLDHVSVAPEPSYEEVVRCGRLLFERRAPTSIVLCTVPATTAMFVRWLAASGHRNLTLYVLASTSGADLNRWLDAATRAGLVSSDIDIYLTQNMPFPSPSPQDLHHQPHLLRKFTRAVPAANRTHAALEGYLTGWFIYEAAMQAEERYGLGITPGDFLYTVFVDVRTFNVLGLTLGPYGDGGISASHSSRQSKADECGQGVHEVFMTRFSASDGSQDPVPGASVKFAKCQAPRLATEGALTLVGSMVRPDDPEDMAVRTGLVAAVMSHNALAPSTIVTRTATGSLSDAVAQFRSSNVSAVVGAALDDAEDARKLGDLPLLAPVPGYYRLRRPFNRSVINLFPSSYDEMAAAVMFFNNRSITGVAVVSNDNSSFTKECLEALEYLKGNRNGLIRMMLEAPTRAFLILGGEVDSWELDRWNVANVRLFNSQGFSQNMTFRTALSPPVSEFASTSSLRVDYATWVSSAETDDRSFQSFLVGKFVGEVLDEAKRLAGPNAHPTPDLVFKAIYTKTSFTFDGFTIGHFSDSCRGRSQRECCNQGLNTVYILQGIFNPTVAHRYSGGDCGRRYLPDDPTDRLENDDTKLGVGLGVGLGGAVLICTLILSTIIWRAKRTVEFFNIRKGEIELGKCLGEGRFGAMYMADWHGTTVSVRVIDKRATPKEDQRLIKEEVLLLHKHHHPNLLMLMGYCETRNDILVVTEYMEGGTLADYLKREKRYASVYSLVAMAFDVLKGIAYLHSCKPAIVHGSICTHNLLMDAKGTVKVSDFWFSNKRGAFSSSGSGRSTKRAAWQPPEVIAGTFLTPATDVYAFGIVLWELIAPPEMTLTSSSASGTASEGQSAHSASTVDPTVSGMLRMSIGGIVEMHSTQLSPPEIPPNASPEVADLLERCWLSQPERRPSIFQILRNWPTTFSSLGEFDIPKDFDMEAPSCAAGVFSHHSSSSINNAVNNNNKPAAAPAEDLSDEMAASMVGIMPVKVNSAALQMPQEPDVGLSAAQQLAAAQEMGAAASISSTSRSRHGSSEKNSQ